MIPEFVPAQILSGEAAMCGQAAFMAMVSLAYIYQVNPRFNAWDHDPSGIAVLISLIGPLVPNPTPGSEFAFSIQDLNQEAVKDIIKARGPPKGAFDCGGGFGIVVF